MGTKEWNDGYYILSRNDPIVLYGAATIGKLLLQSLGEKGYSVNAFFDKRADEIHLHCGLPVYDPKNYDGDRGQAVVLLAVKNVFEHSRIVKGLLKHGYAKIIYRPYDALDGGGTSGQMELNDVYSRLTEEVETEEEIAVPFPVEGIQMELSAQGILKKGAEITAYVPVTIIFTDRKKGVPQFPLLFLKPHMNFVKYLLGMDGGEKESYLEFCTEAAGRTGEVQITNRWKENVVANRAEVFYNMNHMYNIKPSFFVEKAVQAEWNPQRGCFHLKSGKHRAAFLAAVGKNYLPVTMCECDYNLYLSNMDVQAVQRFLPEHYEKGLSMPVENPCFYDYSCCGETFWFLFLRAVMDRFSHWFYQGYKEGILEKISIVIVLPDCGFVKRFFMRMGCRVFSAGWKRRNRLEEAIDSSLKGLPLEMEYNEGGRYDCVISTEEWLEKHVVDAGHRLVLSKNSSRGNGNKIMAGLLNGVEVFLYSERHTINVEI